MQPMVGTGDAPWSRVPSCPVLVCGEEPCYTSFMQVVLHPHAAARLVERGVSQEEVSATVLGGERVPAKFGRVGFRRHFPYGTLWRGKTYATKQVEVFAVEEPQRWMVVTVVARYF